MEEHSAENWHLIVSYLKKEISKSEEDALFTWKQASSQNSETFEQVKKLWELTSTPTNAYEPDVAADWEEFKIKLRKEQIKPEIKAPFKIIDIYQPVSLLKIAAMLIMLVGLGYLALIYLNRETMYEFVTVAGEEKQVTLPDSSRILLKENSRLSFSMDFNKNERIVNFTGTGFFDIRKTEGKKFTVFCGNAVTEVLGTTFHVRTNQSENNVMVNLLTGKVAFYSKRNIEKKVYLEPGESVSLAKGKAITLLKKPIMKKQDNLEFHDMRLQDVFDNLEAYYDVKIEVSNEAINDCRFTGTFMKTNFDKVMRVLSVSLNLSYQNIGNQYTISGQGCK